MRSNLTGGGHDFSKKTLSDNDSETVLRLSAVICRTLPTRTRDFLTVSCSMPPAPEPGLSAAIPISAGTGLPPTFKRIRSCNSACCRQRQLSLPRMVSWSMPPVPWSPKKTNRLLNSSLPNHTDLVLRTAVDFSLKIRQNL